VTPVVINLSDLNCELGGVPSPKIRLSADCPATQGSHVSSEWRNVDQHQLSPPVPIMIHTSRTPLEQPKPSTWCG